MLPADRIQEGHCYRSTDNTGRKYIARVDKIAEPPPGSRGGAAALARLSQEKMPSDMRRVMLAFPMVTTFTVRV